MKVVLHFKKSPQEMIYVEIAGPPKHVNALVEAVRERAKKWQDWEEY